MHVSHGTIIIHVDSNDEFHFALVKDKHNAWGFPKGYSKLKETSKKTAIRETFEECGLILEEKDLGFRFNISYNCIKKGKEVKKQVGLYLVSLKNLEELSIYDKEIIETAWVSEKNIDQYINYPEYSNIINKIINLKSK